MKTLIFVPFILLFLLTSCSDNPVNTPPEEKNITWFTAISWGGPALFKGGAYGNNFVFTQANLSNCPFIRIRAKYISYYDERFFPPAINVTGFGSYYCIKLRKTVYSTYDTIITRNSKDSMQTVNFSLTSAKLYLDSLIILKGYTDY